MASRFFEHTDHAAVYAKFRPQPPPSLIQRIIHILKEKYSGDLKGAADVGCGSGQTTLILTPHFTHVTGLDISQAQINEALQLSTTQNVTFQVSGAETLPFPDSSLQLVTSGQACHWFDLPKFYKEVDRVLVPGGVLALYGYLKPRPIHPTKADSLYKIEDELFNVTLGDYWGSGIEHVEDQYQDPKFVIPYQELNRDNNCYVDKETTVTEFGGFITTWSAFSNYRRKNGDKAAQELLNDFLNRVMKILDVTTSQDETKITIRFNFFLLTGRKPL